eukprot:3357051-Pyramimonas_sp.AAC.1
MGIASPIHSRATPPRAPHALSPHFTIIIVIDLRDTSVIVQTEGNTAYTCALTAGTRTCRSLMTSPATMSSE